MYTWISIAIILVILLLVHLTSRNRLDLPGMYPMRRIAFQLGFCAIFVLLTAYYTGRDIRSPLAIWFANMLSSWRAVAFTMFVLPFEAVVIFALSIILCSRRNVIF